MCDLPTELLQHLTGTICMVGIFPNNTLHCLTHDREYENLFIKELGRFLTCGKGIQNTSHLILVELPLLIANLLPKIVIVIDDGTELFYQSMSLLSHFGIPQELRIGFSFFGTEITVGLDQLPDSLFCHRPLHKELCIFFLVCGRKTVKSNAIDIMVFPNTAAWDSIAAAAHAIFLL